MSEVRKMVVTYRVEDGILHCDRVTENFPVDDFDKAIDLLRADLEKEKKRVNGNAK